MISAACAALVTAAAPLLQSSEPPGPGQSQAWLHQARAQLSVCQSDVPFLLALGLILLRVNEAEEGAEHLERALLLAPQDSAARLAFARALEALGDTRAAAGLLAELRSEGHLPPSTAQHSAAAGDSKAVATRVPSAPANESGARWQWALQSGYERNLLGATSLASVTLTLPGLDPGQPILVTLPVDEENRPRAGGYLQGNANFQWAWRQEGSPSLFGMRTQTLNAQGGLRLRHVSSLQRGGFAVLEAGVEHLAHYQLASGAPAPAQLAPFKLSAGLQPGHYLAIGAVALNSRTGVRFDQVNIAAGLALASPSCQARLGAEVLNRRYPSNPGLDGQQQALHAQWGCSARPLWSWRAGRDTPASSDRAGGEQRFGEWRVGYGAGRFNADAEISRISDAKPYSPLLQEGAVRHQQRAGLRLQYGWPFGQALAASGLAGNASGCTVCRGWQLSVGLEAQRQTSNINLFKTNNLGVFLMLAPTK